MVNIVEKFLPTPSARRSGQKIKGVSFIVSHDTGNDGSTAQQNVDYYIKSANETQASAHFFVDDKGVICCIPETEKAWHVRYDVQTDNQIFGKDANDWALSIELCFSSKGTMDNAAAYQNYVKLHAYLCNKYHLDPLMAIIGHYKLDPTRRTDPVNAFKYIGRTWEQFVQDVNAAMPQFAPNVAPPPEAKPENASIIAQIRTKHQEIEDLLSQLK